MCHTQTARAQGQGSSAQHTHTAAGWLLQNKYKESGALMIQDLSSTGLNILHCTKYVICSLYFIISILVMHAVLCFNWTPVVYSGLFASLVL